MELVLKMVPISFIIPKKVTCKHSMKIAVHAAIANTTYMTKVYAQHRVKYGARGKKKRGGTIYGPDLRPQQVCEVASDY